MATAVGAAFSQYSAASAGLPANARAVMVSAAALILGVRLMARMIALPTVDSSQSRFTDQGSTMSIVIIPPGKMSSVVTSFSLWECHMWK